LYVCNDIRYQKYRASGLRDFNSDKIISDATIEKLEAESKYAIIEGIGGIGKSMLLTHLFLSSASSETRTTPLFLSLKDYKDTTSNIVDFICKSVNGNTFFQKGFGIARMSANFPDALISYFQNTKR